MEIHPSLPAIPYILFSITTICTAILSTLIIRNYNPYVVYGLQLPFASLSKPIATSNTNQPHPTSNINAVRTIIRNPSTPIFVTACLLYVSNASIFIYIHKHNPRQSYHITLGIAGALIGTILHGHKHAGYFMQMKAFLCIYIFGAMIYSAASHALQRIQITRGDTVQTKQRERIY